MSTTWPTPMPTHDTKKMQEVSGVFLLICPALEYDPTILLAFEMANCRQIITGFYSRVFHELAYKVVASIEGLEGSGRLSSAIVEWGNDTSNRSKTALLVGPLPADFKKYNWVQSWDVPQAWVHVHVQYFYEYIYINIFIKILKYLVDASTLMTFFLN
jgi:hypothetical protein